MNSNGNVAWEHTNVWAGGQLLATYDPNGIHFYLSDWTGSRRVQTNYEGVVEQTCTNLPYGNGESCSATPTEELYAGLERDSESGLDHAMFRQYSSAFGRWTTPDPYGGSYDLTNPQSLNRYAYVGGSPFSGVDPSGLDDSGCFMPSYSTTPVCALSFGSKAASAVLQSTSLDGLLTSLGTVGNFLDSTPIGTLTTGVELVYDFGQAFGWWGGGSSFHGNAAASQSGKNVPSAASSASNTGCSSKPGLLPSTIGLVGGGEASAGVAATGATAQSSQGIFGTLNGGTGWVSSTTAVANYGSNVASGASPVDTPITFGGYAGIGAGLVFSNATNLQQLSGPFESYTLSIPAASFSFSTGGGIWEFQVSLGPGFGLSHTYATSNTRVTGNTQPCH